MQLHRTMFFEDQFRDTKDSEKSPVEVINWGLQHNDRLRKARIESKDVSVKQWQLWLVFGTAAVGVIVQIIIATFFNRKLP